MIIIRNFREATFQYDCKEGKMPTAKQIGQKDYPPWHRDVTQPIALAIIETMHKAVDEMGHAGDFSRICTGSGI